MSPARFVMMNPSEVLGDDRSKEPIDGPSQVPSEDPSEVPSKDPGKVPSEDAGEVPLDSPSRVPREDSGEVPSEDRSPLPSHWHPVPAWHCSRHQPGLGHLCQCAGGNNVYMSSR